MSYFCQRWLETKVPRKTQPILWTTLLASLIQCLTHLLPLLNWLCSTSCTDPTSSSSSVLLGLSSATFSLCIRVTNHLGLPGSEVFPHMDFSAKTNTLGHTKDDWSPYNILSLTHFIHPPGFIYSQQQHHLLKPSKPEIWESLSLTSPSLVTCQILSILPPK